MIYGLRKNAVGVLEVGSKFSPHAWCRLLDLQSERTLRKPPSARKCVREPREVKRHVPGTNGP